MGEEITYSRFVKTDYHQYEKRLRQETDILAEWFSNHSLSNKDLVAGYELEAWLIDNNASPCPRNEAFLQHADNPYIFPELAKFNIELNVQPQSFNSSLLSDFEKQLQQLWQQCKQTSNDIGCNMLGIGILPTLTNNDLSLDNISSLDRYRALNEQVLRLRQGRTIGLKQVHLPRQIKVCGRWTLPTGTCAIDGIIREHPWHSQGRTDALYQIHLRGQLFDPGRTVTQVMAAARIGILRNQIRVGGYQAHAGQYKGITRIREDKVTKDTIKKYIEYHKHSEKTPQQLKLF